MNFLDKNLGKKRKFYAELFNLIETMRIEMNILKILNKNFLDIIENDISKITIYCLFKVYELKYSSEENQKIDREIDDAKKYLSYLNLIEEESIQKTHVTNNKIYIGLHFFDEKEIIDSLINKIVKTIDTATQTPLPKEKLKLAKNYLENKF